ncbi:MAG: hypothetical protein WAO35_21110, partial [Terriglobia bacterium]
FLTVGVSHVRCSSGRPSIGMEHAATVALSKVSLLELDHRQKNSRSGRHWPWLRPLQIMNYEF